MTVIIFQKMADYHKLSESACDRLIDVIRHKPNAVICLATGGSPLLTYQLFVRKVQEQHLDISQVTFVELDEWIGLPSGSPGTCQAFLQEQIIKPLNISEKRFISFSSTQADIRECERVTTQIAQLGGLDFCLLGFGKNGHLGLNEPGAALEPGCHITSLAEQTRQHEMVHQASSPVEQGITLGLKDILAAKEVLLLVAGDGKQEAFSTFCKGKLSTSLPASFLWLHTRTLCLYDGEFYNL